MPSDKQRREAARRKLNRQQQRRGELAARRRRNNVIGSVAGVVVVIAVVIALIVGTDGGSGGTPTGSRATAATAATSSSSTSSSPAQSSTPAPTTIASSAGQVAAYPCTWTKDGPAARPVTVPQTTTPPRAGVVTVSVSTSQGPMAFSLNRAEAPCAVESFLSLARQKYFDDTPCHRLTSGALSVLQCGDPTGTGAGGPGYSFDDELTGKEVYSRGVLAMANSGPNTNGSQFFICYQDSTLGPQYTIFGRVSAGLAVVDKVAARGSSPAGDGKPKLPITLTAVTVAK